MSVRSNITQAAGWFLHEAKILQITVLDAAGDPVDLSSTSLLWRLMHGNTELINKTSGAGIAVSGAGNNIVSITIDQDADYDGLEAGIYRHELWDASNDALLSYGDAWLQHAVDPTPAAPP